MNIDEIIIPPVQQNRQALPMHNNYVENNHPTEITIYVVPEDEESVDSFKTESKNNSFDTNSDDDEGFDNPIFQLQRLRNFNRNYEILQEKEQIKCLKCCLIASTITFIGIGIITAIGVSVSLYI